MSLPTIAVLDDYQGISKAPFERLRSAGYQVTTFTDTLPPYNHPDTRQDAKDALVDRLEPFNIICTLMLHFPLNNLNLTMYRLDERKDAIPSRA